MPFSIGCVRQEARSLSVVTSVTESPTEMWAVDLDYCIIVWRPTLTHTTNGGPQDRHTSRVFLRFRQSPLPTPQGEPAPNAISRGTSADHQDDDSVHRVGDPLRELRASNAPRAN